MYEHFVEEKGCHTQQFQQKVGVKIGQETQLPKMGVS